MPKGYKHLTYEQRCQISALLQSKISQKHIATTLGISTSQVSRELKRNANKNGHYNHSHANYKAIKRKRNSALNPKKIVDHIAKYLHEKLYLGWSPMQIAGRLWRDYKQKISPSAIYAFLANDRRQGGKLYLHLRRKGRKKRDYNRKKASKSLIPNRVDIDQRPSVVERKARIGDWEADTVVGKGHKSGLITLVDRKSKHALVVRINNFKADNVAGKIIAALQKHSHKVHTITFDNGLEFASHTKITECFPHVKTYFAKPYKSWQRGLNEHTNGLIRRYLPKGTDFTKVSDLKVMTVQNKLNNRPRAVLNFKTPEEVFFRCYSKL
jgi:IS30 family transposase